MLVEKISRKNLYELLKKYSTDKRTLEIGAHGSPGYTQYFKNRVGVDIKTGPGVDIQASVYELPFKDQEFDVVLCLSVLEHLEDPKKAILEMKRVLKPGGLILVSVPFMFPIHDAPGDYWRFTKFGLQKLFYDWEIIELKAESNTHQTLAIILQRIGYQTKLKVNKLSKLIVFILAKLFSSLPKMSLKTYGDIHKSIEESEAFTSAFFLAALKNEK